MNRRVVAVIGIAVALIASRSILNRGIHRVDAARAGHEALASAATQPAASAAAEAIPERVGNEASPANPADPVRRAESGPATPAARASQDGLTEVDPHKAFGSKSAPVVMEVFSDYQCPSCKAFYETTNRQLMDNYVSTGKVYLIHRDFPLQMHAYSRVAARYARAAAEIGKIEPAEKALYDNQEKWEQTGDVDGTLTGVFSSADMTKIRALVKGGTLEPLIDRDYQLGMGYRVGSTPTTVFHYKGQTYPYAGGMSYEMLHQFLDQLLSQK
ncbi:MAG TPA: thioredoxin domain-containing protein [Candidatus Methylomirabilis sp.]|nr:thioredoxin domain-containing protein [Candidatus Methylomirabilis sp.]